MTLLITALDLPVGSLEDPHRGREEGEEAAHGQDEGRGRGVRMIPSIEKLMRSRTPGWNLVSDLQLALTRSEERHRSLSNELYCRNLWFHMGSS